VRQATDGTASFHYPANADTTQAPVPRAQHRYSNDLAFAARSIIIADVDAAWARQSVSKLASLHGRVKRKQHRVSKWRVKFVSKCLEKFDREQSRLSN
jgi:hypothetical protein